MPDITLRFHKDMLVLSSPVAVVLARQGFDVEHDLEFANLVEPEAVRDALRLNKMAGAQCLVANAEGIAPARLAHRGMEDRAAEIVRTGLSLARELKSQHVLVEIGPCGLPLAAASKSSLNENRDPYARAARACDGQEFAALFPNGFANPADLTCALLGVRPVRDTPVMVTGGTSEGGSRLTVDCPSNGGVSVRAASDIGASTNKVVVTVRDATKTKEREVTGTINVSVMDKPDAPLLSAVSGDPQDGAVNLSWTAGSANGSPITEYKVMWGGDASGERSCGQKTSCLIDGLKNGKTYSFKVQARNEVGWSKDSNAVEGTPDKLPDAPTDVTASVKGNKVNATGKPPDRNFPSVAN